MIATSESPRFSRRVRSTSEPWSRAGVDTWLYIEPETVHMFLRTPPTGTPVIGLCIPGIEPAMVSSQVRY
jgi:hypothetical protein